MVIPFATRLEYGRKRRIIIGGTKKKNIFDTLKTKSNHQIIIPTLEFSIIFLSNRRANRK
jgi:hypothetical protein